MFTAFALVSGCHKTPVDRTPPDIVEHIITKQWAIIPDRIVVPQGKEVELIVTSPDVEHGLQIQGYGISAPVQPGEPAVIKFRAIKPGTFVMRCDILCGRGHNRMRGQLIVTPAPKTAFAATAGTLLKAPQESEVHK